MAADPLFHSEALGEFASRFDEATVACGRTHVGEGRVQVKRVERSPGEIHVEAVVQGPRQESCEVDLWLELDAAGTIVDVDNACMCPRREN